MRTIMLCGLCLCLTLVAGGCRDQPKYSATSTIRLRDADGGGKAFQKEGPALSRELKDLRAVAAAELKDGEEAAEVEHVPGTDLVRVRVTGRDPARVMRLCDRITERYSERSDGGVDRDRMSSNPSLSRRR